MPDSPSPPPGGRQSHPTADEPQAAERRVAANTLWLTAQPLALNVVSLASTAFIARTIGASDFGRFSLGLAFVALFAPLTSLGLRPLTVRHMARARGQEGRFLGDQLVLRLLLAGVTAALVIAGASLSGGSDETRQVIVIAALTLLPSAAASVFEDGLSACELMRPISLAGLFGGVTLTVTSVIAVALGGGTRGLALAYAVGPVVQLVILWWWTMSLRLRPVVSLRWQHYPPLLREAFPFFAAGFVETATLRLDLLVLARVVGESGLGPYSAAMMLVERASVIAHGASAALLPAISRLKAQDPIRAAALLRQATVALLFITLPGAALTAAFSGSIMGLIFGGEFVGGWPLLAAGIWAVPGSCLVIVQMQALYAADRQAFVLTTKTATAAVSAPLLIVLIGAFGALGGALIRLVRIALTLALRLRRARADFPDAWPMREVWRLLVSTSLMALPLAASFSLRLSLAAIVLGILACLVYLTATTMTGVVPVGEVMKRRLGFSGGIR